MAIYENRFLLRVISQLSEQYRWQSLFATIRQCCLANICQLASSTKLFQLLKNRDIEHITKWDTGKLHNSVKISRFIFEWICLWVYICAWCICIWWCMYFCKCVDVYHVYILCCCLVYVYIVIFCSVCVSVCESVCFFNMIYTVKHPSKLWKNYLKGLSNQTQNYEVQIISLPIPDL